MIDKQAQAGAPAFNADNLRRYEQRLDSDSASNDSMQMLGNALMIGLASGALTRGVGGLLNFGKRPKVYTPTSARVPIPIGSARPEQLPKTKEEKPKPLGLPAPAEKAAADEPWYGDLLSPSEWARFGSGAKADAPATVPWLGAALTVGLPAAFVGGYGAVDAISDSFRKQEREEELDRAQGAFQGAVRKQFTLGRPDLMHSPQSKAAAEGDALDRAYEVSQAPDAEKQADLFDYLLGPDVGGQVKGLAANGYFSMAVPAALGSAYFTHQALKPTTKRQVLENAERKRRQLMSQSSSIPAYAVGYGVGES